MPRLANIDKVALGELSCSLLNGKHIQAKFKLVDTKTGKSHGSTSQSTWGPVVMEKFKELQEALEKEVEDRVFDEKTEEAPAAKAGLGEMFSDESESV